MLYSLFINTTPVSKDSRMGHELHLNVIQFKSKAIIVSLCILCNLNSWMKNQRVFILDLRIMWEQFYV